MSTMTALEFCEFLHMQWSHEGSGVQQIGFNVFQPRCQRYVYACSGVDIKGVGLHLWAQRMPQCSSLPMPRSLSTSFILKLGPSLEVWRSCPACAAKILLNPETIGNQKRDRTDAFRVLCPWTFRSKQGTGKTKVFPETLLQTSGENILLRR